MVQIDDSNSNVPDSDILHMEQFSRSKKLARLAVEKTSRQQMMVDVGAVLQISKMPQS